MNGLRSGLRRLVTKRSFCFCPRIIFALPGLQLLRETQNRIAWRMEIVVQALVGRLVIARTCSVRSNLDRNIPRFDPVFHSLQANHRPTPSAMAMRIEPVCIGLFQIPICARTCRGKRAPALRASKQKHMSKTFRYRLHATPCEE
jgi:hypothetical protein